MCTALTLSTAQGETFFGRTMDFSYPLAPRLYHIPSGYEWRNALNSGTIRNRYSVIGIGQPLPEIVLADGVNEKGLAGATLYFPGYADFESSDLSMPSTSVAAFELVLYLLGACTSVNQIPSALSSVRIAGVEDPVTNTVAPLHWIFCDHTGACVVLEQTKGGMQLFDNPLGILSNSPDFPWHMTNLRNYVNVEPSQRAEASWSGIPLTPFGQGGGTFGLPGDFTPPSRFVRTAYLKSHTRIPADRQEAIVTGFHILENVSIPKGAVVTGRGTDDYTQYTAFINTSNGQYFFKTYDNSEMAASRYQPGSMSGTEPVSLGELSRPTAFYRYPSPHQIQTRP